MTVMQLLMHILKLFKELLFTILQSNPLSTKPLVAMVALSLPLMMCTVWPMQGGVILYGAYKEISKELDDFEQAKQLLYDSQNGVMRELYQKVIKEEQEIREFGEILLPPACQ
jgi:hypothetical protein